MSDDDLHWCRSIAGAMGAPGATAEGVARSVGGRLEGDGLDRRVWADAFGSGGSARLRLRVDGRHPDVLTWYPGGDPRVTIERLERLLGPPLDMASASPATRLIRFPLPDMGATVIASVDPHATVYELAWRRDHVD